MRTALTIIAIIAIPSACLAWNGHEVTQGDLKILIEEVDEVTQRDTPVDVIVSLTNSGDKDISGTLEARGMVDDSRVVGDTRKPFEVAAGETAEVGFQIAFGARTYSALYPVHVDAEFDGQTASAVRIVKTQFATGDTTSDDPTEIETIVVPEEGAVGLWTLRSHRVAWNYYDGPLRYKPAGWMGGDGESRASFGV